MYLDEADKLFITHIDYEFTGDTYFPEIDFGKWEIELKINGIKDEKNPYDYYFAVYKRVNKKTD
ncbi:Dihydrofolate reductase [compost metagenome]